MALRKQGKFVRGTGPKPARVALIGEAPGKEESFRGVPFVGDSGTELSELYFPLAGLRRSQVYIDNVWPWRPPNNQLKHFRIICQFKKSG